MESVEAKMTSPRDDDDVVVTIDAFSRANGGVYARIHSIFLSADAFFVTDDALDGHEAAVPRHRNGRLGPARGAAGYFTRNEAGGLQSPCPLFVVARTLNCTVVATGSPVIVVLACSVCGTSIHVLPPSMLYCQSYDARPAAAFEMT